MTGRQKIYGRVPGQQRHLWMTLQCPDQLHLDAFSRGVRGMNDAGQAVPAFQGQRQFAIRPAIKDDRSTLQQNVPYRLRPFLSQNADRGRVAVACAVPLHILCQQSRRIPLAHVDDAALRQICV